MRCRFLAPLLIVLAAADAGAQTPYWTAAFVMDGEPFVQYESGYSSAVDVRRQTPDGLALAIANFAEGRFGVFASHAEGDGGNSVQFWSSSRLSFTNTTGGDLRKTIEVYADGFTAGSDDDWRYGGRGTFGIGVQETERPGVQYGSSVTIAKSPYGQAAWPQRYAAPFEIVLRPGTTSFTFFIDMAAQASGDWIADLSHTGRIFVPPTEGVTWTGAGGFLSRQARPAWAVTTTTTPEPGTWTLLGTGLLALAAGARRARRRT